jgi:hypothetical protein
MRAGAIVGDVKEPADGGVIAEEVLAPLPCAPIDVDHDDFGVVIGVDEEARVAADDVERRLKEGVKFFVATGKRGVAFTHNRGWFHGVLPVAGMSGDAGSLRTRSASLLSRRNAAFLTPASLGEVVIPVDVASGALRSRVSAPYVTGGKSLRWALIAIVLWGGGERSPLCGVEA